MSRKGKKIMNNDIDPFKRDIIYKLFIYKTFKWLIYKWSRVRIQYQITLYKRVKFVKTIYGQRIMKRQEMAR